MTEGGRPATKPRVILPYNVEVSDVMSRNPLTIGPNARLYDALVVMRTNHITGLPVVDAQGRLDGVISERDLARSLNLPTTVHGSEGMLDILAVDPLDDANPTLSDLRSRLAKMVVADVMSRPPLSIHGNAPLEFAMEVMTENEIHRLPVVHGDRLVGIVTSHDLLRSFLRASRS